MSKTIKIPFTNILDYKSGNSCLTKLYISEHAGIYPVYSAKTQGETKVGEIDSYMFDMEGIQLTTNGANAGTWLYREKHKFSLNGDARLYFPKEEYESCVHIPYLYYALKHAFKTKTFDWNTKATINNTQNIKISIPVNASGDFDLSKQKELAKKYQDIEQKKKQLLEKAEEIKKVKILINRNNGISYKKIPINSMFKHNNGKSIYTKEYCRAHSGPFPVFSANNKFPIGHMENADYSGEYLTYSKNGCAGYITIMNGDFSVNGDRCVLTFNDGYENIDLLYLKYLLEPIFRAHIKGRIGINGKNEYTKINSTLIKKLNISIPIPIKEDGSFDIEKQRELAQKYAVIDSIKDDIHKKIIQLTNMAVV